MTPEEQAAHVRRLADSHCRAKHRSYYDSLICVGPNSQGFGPPCDGCIRETEQRLSSKRAKAQGIELTEDEAMALKKRLGLE
jgi:hypothetical protein